MKNSVISGMMIAAMISTSVFVGTGAITMASASEPMKVCSGASGGNYEFTAKTIQSQLKGMMEVEVINTAGSWENLQKLTSGECDVAISQSDAIFLWEQENGKFGYADIGSLYTEYAHLLCNKDSRIKEFSDLNETSKVYGGGKGSGSEITLKGLIKADTEYGNGSYTKVQILNEIDPRVALVKVKSGAADCLAYTGSKGNKFMSTDAEKLSASLQLVPIVDKDFNDVEMVTSSGDEISVWSPTEMPSDTYKSLMPSGWMGNKSLDTVAVTARLLASEKWVESNPSEFATLGLEIDGIANIVRAEKKLELLAD